jgi:hypothetical protein
VQAGDAFRRYDETPDPLFYLQPRFVTHIDDAAVAAVTQLYREFFAPDGAILDLMSSWVSHLPPGVAYRRVVGIGLNRQELAANPRLDEFLVQDLNQSSDLAYAAVSSMAQPSACRFSTLPNRWPCCARLAASYAMVRRWW